MPTEERGEETTALHFPEQRETTPLLSSLSSPPVQQRFGTAITIRIVNRKEITGLFIILLASFAHSCSSVTVKWTSLSFSTMEIIFVSSISQAMFGFFGCLWFGVNPFPRSYRMLLLLQGVFGSLTTLCLYHSLAFLPVGEATVIFYLYPLIIGALAALFFKISFGWFETLSFVFCLLGTIMVSKPYVLFGIKRQKEYPDIAVDGNAEFIAMMSALFAASTYITQQHQYRRNNSTTLIQATEHHQIHFLSFTFVTGCILFLLAIPITLFGSQKTLIMPTNWMDYLKPILVGFVAFCHQCLANFGLQSAPIGLGTLVYMNDILFTFVFGACLFNEYPDVFSIVGGFLTISMNSAVAINKWINDK
ncbi:hypothetical protein BDC45DRAFT_438256 [Circinella umbellata]|nr:hypothetical protein BDC45DRAFT_438256 [Circinella umbellata]